MNSSLDTCNFKEALLRLYLGKYQHRFKYRDTNPLLEPGFVLSTEYPMIVARLFHHQIDLFEYIKIEKSDPHFNLFDFYQIEILTVSIEDPNGIEKVEKAVTKSFLVGTQS